MEPVFEDLWNRWPSGLCTVSCLLLAPILRAGIQDFRCELALGYLKDHKHCWIEADELIIDPTYHQFKLLPKASNYQFGIFPKESEQYSLYKGKMPINTRQEEHYRNTIKINDYGTPNSGMKELFKDL